ncbi:MAG: RDD family protein [Pseudomonadota bacterium]
MLDTLQRFETPEGVELGLKLAGPVSRGLAWSIDLVIKTTLFSVGAVAFALVGGIGEAAILLLMFMLLWVYNVLFEVLTAGATPGKKLLGLRVVNANGTPVTWGGSILRNLVRVVDFMPLCYGFGLVSCLLNRRFQRIGDMAADTVVVYQTAPPAPLKQTVEQSTPLRLPLSLEEQRWILAFSERSGRLSRERRAELAELLEAVTGQRGDEAVAMLQAHGNWLAGRQ